MLQQPLPPAPELPRQRPRRRRSAWSLRITPAGLLLLVLFNLLILGVLAWPLIQMKLGGIPAWLSPVFTRQAMVLPSATPSSTASP